MRSRSKPHLLQVLAAAKLASQLRLMHPIVLRHQRLWPVTFRPLAIEASLGDGCAQLLLLLSQVWVQILTSSRLGAMG